MAWAAWDRVAGRPSGHSLCHGVLGVWELLHRADALGLGPAGRQPAAMAAEVLADLTARGR